MSALETITAIFAGIAALWCVTGFVGWVSWAYDYVEKWRRNDSWARSITGTEFGFFFLLMVIGGPATWWLLEAANEDDDE